MLVLVGCGDGFSAGTVEADWLSVKVLGAEWEETLNVGWDVGASSLVGADVGRDLPIPEIHLPCTDL